MFILKNNPSLRRMRLMRRDFGATCTHIYNLSLRIVRQMRRGFGTWCTNSYMSDKIPSSCPLDASAGRSMVEMLGVLAIIGVLSVGAIAGYSKAMMKYKLNKQTEQINQLFNGITQYYHQLSPTANLLPVLKKLNIVPVEMLTNNATYIRDVFNNPIFTNVNSCETDSVCAILVYYFDSEDTTVCRNILNTIKENAGDLYVVELISNWRQEGATYSSFGGDAWCGRQKGLRKCLKNITLNDMEDMCAGVKGKNSIHLKVWWISQ